MNQLEDDEILAETENMYLWRSKEEEIGYIYHIELGGITLHLMPDEWDELFHLIKSADS